ncbi:hypothetical protein [Microbacterium sp.]|uniref:hypothetical protein n=1 Tax=Microbacterium sp. TaxID=51671 RepID=UPI0039E6E3EC
MPITPGPLDPQLGSVFTVAAALRSGTTPGRLRSHDLERPYRGVRRRREPQSVAETSEPFALDRAIQARVLRDARAYFQVAPEHAFLAGRSAAVAWGLPCEPGPELCIGVPAPHRAPRRPGIRGVQVSAGLTSIRQHGGLRILSPAATWAALGGELTHRELVIVGDAIARIPRDRSGTPRPELQLASLQQLAAAAMAPRRRNRSELLRALDVIRVGSMSPLETDYRLLASSAGLPEPQLDVEIRDAAGVRIGIGDVVYLEWMTIVEVEGDQHRTSRAQWQRDLSKYAAYASAGYEVVRLGGDQIRGHGAPGAAIVRDALRRRGWRG